MDRGTKNMGPKRHPGKKPSCSCLALETRLRAEVFSSVPKSFRELQGWLLTQHLLLESCRITTLHHNHLTGSDKRPRPQRHHAYHPPPDFPTQAAF